MRSLRFYTHDEGKIVVEPKVVKLRQKNSTSTISFCSILLLTGVLVNFVLYLCQKMMSNPSKKRAFELVDTEVRLKPARQPAPSSPTKHTSIEDAVDFTTDNGTTGLEDSTAHAGDVGELADSIVKYSTMLYPRLAVKRFEIFCLLNPKT
jgi:hypothetical protein